MKKYSAKTIVSALLEDCVPGGAAPDNHDWDYIDPEQLAIGTEIELEHTSDRRIAQEIAADHLTEDPDYYRKLKKAGLAKQITPPPKISFYPSDGGPSSL